MTEPSANHPGLYMDTAHNRVEAIRKLIAEWRQTAAFHRLNKEFLGLAAADAYEKAANELESALNIIKEKK